MAVRFSGLARSTRWLRRFVAGAMVSGLLLTATARVSPAQDVGSALRDVGSSDDFRVRANAAALLGRARPRGAREVLERALNDAHPLVRTAAAVALASLGDSTSVPALERQMARESSPGAKAQMKSSIESLKRGGTAMQRARFVVLLGNMKNNSGVRGDALADFLLHAARSRARMVPGVIVTDGKDAGLLRDAADKHVPVLMLDGSINGITQGREDKSVTFRAQVEFSLRKNQELKGRLTGAATSFGSLQVLGDQARVAELQNDAVDGAVQSALRGADVGLSLASK
jgi:HEAT repeat protein